MIASIHQMLALYLKMPAIALSESDAAALGEAVANVQQYYPDAVFDPKHMAWLALAGAVFRIEGPRAVLVARELKARQNPQHPHHKRKKGQAHGAPS